MLKTIGAALILGAALWTGFRGSRALRMLERHLRELCAALRIMESEISCANARFPALCRVLSERCGGAVGAYFQALAGGDGPAVGGSSAAIERAGLQLTAPAHRCLDRLMDSFGVYDLEGQLLQVRAAREELDAELEKTRTQTEERCRLRKLLGLCAGAAVLILVA